MFSPFARFDPETDRRRFHVSDSGITVVASGPKSYFARSEPGINPGSYSW
ncbi:MAG TPA: hypothetical protein VK855_03165 [Thioalkalivibrio sp.]|nr:hypothetical protein [Thioalkalivibrio sp.]